MKGLKLAAVLFMFQLRLVCFVGPSCLGAAHFDKVPPRSQNFLQLLEKAGRGDLHAQFAGGMAYESGTGTELDYGEAARWYRVATDRGDVGAQNNLGSRELSARRRDFVETTKFGRGCDPCEKA